MLKTEYFRGFGRVSLEDWKLLPNGQVEAIFDVDSSDPQALDIVTKVAHGITGVMTSCKNRTTHKVTLWLGISDAAHFGVHHPFIRGYFDALKSKVNGSDKMRMRRSGMLVV